MAATRASNTTFVDNTNRNTRNITAPSATNGQVIVMWVQWFSGGNAPAAQTSVPGFTPIGRVQAGASWSLECHIKVSSGSEPASYTVATSTFVQTYAAFTLVNGADTTTPHQANATMDSLVSSGILTSVIPSVIPANNGSCIIAADCVFATGLVTQASPYTEDWDVGDGWAGGYLNQTTAAATGTSTWGTDTSDGWITGAVIIQPPTTPPATLTYMQVGADGAGKKERTQTFVDGSDTTHVAYNINVDESTGNQTRMLNAHPSTSDYALISRNLDEGEPGGIVRYAHSYTAKDLNSNTTETLQTLTPVADFVAETAGTSFVVPANRVFRIQAFILACRIANATSPPLYGWARLRVDPSTTVTAASPMVAEIMCFVTKAAAIGVGDVRSSPVGNGIDIPAGASWGITLQTATGTAARTLWDITVIGYEFDV